MMQRFAGIIGALNRKIPPRLGTTDKSDLLALASMAWNIRRLGKDDMREFLRIAGINIYDVLEERFENNLLKGALSLDGTLGTFLGARSNNSVFCALHRMSGGNRYDLPLGGMGAVSDAIATAAVKAGATIRASSRVQRVILDFDKACGVELENGEQIMAGQIISSTDPVTTFKRLLGMQHLEAGFAHRVKNIRNHGNVAKLHLALNGLPGFSGLDPASSGARLLIAPGMDYVERAFNSAKYGEYSNQPVMEISIPSVHDPALAPAGHHVLSAVVQWAPYQLKSGWDNESENYKELIINTIEQYAPGIRNQIVHSDLVLPHDLQARYGMTGGHWHHAELALDQSMMMRPVPGAAQYQTPVDGLWLCGAGSHPGGGVMGHAGRNAKAIK